MTSRPSAVALQSTPDVDLSLLEPVFLHYQGQPGALIPVLQQAQHLYGYLPKEAMALIAKRLGTSISKVYGVATFYAQFYFERRGRHIVRVCDGTACHVKGAPMLLNAIEDGFHIEPDQTTPDGELTVEIIYCLGSCALAPVAVLDGRVMGRVRQEGLMRAVRQQMQRQEAQS